MNYQVKLENFEGPMDLLLFFIQRDRLNIYDIPIAHVASEFLKYMSMMESLNIDIGGEFVNMASMLMKIKTKMLLPVSEDEDEIIEDPRMPLVERLLEYKQFKYMAGQLQEKRNIHYHYYPKGNEMQYDKKMKAKAKYVENMNIFSLVSTFQELILNLPEVNPYEVSQEKINLEQQIVFILDKFKNKKQLFFHSIAPYLNTRLHIIVTFMAILEMIRSKQISIKQKESFGELILIKSSTA